MPLNNARMDLAMSVEVAGPSDGYDIPYRFRNVPGADPATADIGRVEAVSASTGETLWSCQQRAPICGSRRRRGRDPGDEVLDLTPELTTPSGSNTLFVFALP